MSTYRLFHKNWMRQWRQRWWQSGGKCANCAIHFTRVAIVTCSWPMRGKHTISIVPIDRIAWNTNQLQNKILAMTARHNFDRLLLFLKFSFASDDYATLPNTIVHYCIFNISTQILWIICWIFFLAAESCLFRSFTVFFALNRCNYSFIPSRTFGYLPLHQNIARKLFWMIE